MESIPEDTAAKVKLSPREKQVVEMLAQGLAQKEIAFKLGISRQTVYCHLYSAKEKTGCATTISAIAFLVDQGYVVINSV